VKYQYFLRKISTKTTPNIYIPVPPIFCLDKMLHFFRGQGYDFGILPKIKKANLGMWRRLEILFFNMSGTFFRRDIKFWHAVFSCWQKV
jgi:hypothetical protein